MSLWDNCEGCPSQGFPQPSKHFSWLNKDIMVIGEVLTHQEARKNECMTGPAVTILKDTMKKVGLPTGPDKVHYTTAIMCATPRKKGAQFNKEILRCCRTRLLAEIHTVAPKIIIVLGKTALSALTDDHNLKITSEYGRPRQYPYCGDAQVIPVAHPALMMRTPKDYKNFLSMMHIIRKLYVGEGLYDSGIATWEVLDTEEKCDAAIEKLSHYERVGADIETTDLDYRVAEFCVLGISYEKNKAYVIPREMRHRCKDFFAIPNLKWIWHHGKYDKKVMWRRGLGDVSIDDDTIYQHYMLDETSAHDLGTLTKLYLQAEEYKFKMNQNFKAVTLDTYEHFFESLCERVAVDCDYTLQLYYTLEAELEKPENKALKYCYDNLIIPAANFLSRVEQNGMLIDKSYLESLDVKYDAELDRIMNDIVTHSSRYWDRDLYMEQTGAKTASVNFNPGSPKQMAWMVYDRLKLRPRRRKARSTDAEVLESIEEDIPLIKSVLEYRSVKKEQSTYVRGLLKLRDIDGRVRSTFSLHIAATGRLTSKEPNVQNQPSANGVGNIRRAFIPRKGYTIMEVDYSGAELRWMAFLSKCKVLTDIFVNNRNLHNETATSLYGPGFTKQQKMRAKAVNFGIPYGREAQSFKDEFNIPIEEAIAMVQGWLNAYPGCRDYLQWCADQVLDGKYLETPWGRRRRFGLVTKESIHNLQNEARNFPIQSASSDLLLFCAMFVEKELKEKYDTKIIDLVHDSMVLEVPMDKEIACAVSKYVSGIMVQAPKEIFNCPVPFKTDTDIGTHWGNVEAFNNETGCIERENVDGSITEIPYEEFMTQNNINDVYEQEWYTQLQVV